MAKKKKATTETASSSGVKRVRYDSADDADEDDFEMVPYRARTKNACAAPAAEAEEAVVIADQRRICPKVLVEALKGLNDQQRRAVHQLGFSSVLHLQVGTVPARMISWCLSKFMGGRLKDWSVGFDTNAEKVLQELRIKYTKVILTSDANIKRNEVSKRVQFWLSGLRSVK